MSRITEHWPGASDEEERGHSEPPAQHRVLDLQSVAGNAATVRMLRQLATPDHPFHGSGEGPLVSVVEGPGPTPASVPPAPVSMDGGVCEAPADPLEGGFCVGEPPPMPAAGSTLSSARARKVAYARTTLSRVTPLGPADEALLRKVIPTTPLFGMIIDRDTAGRIVQELTGKIAAQEFGATEPDEQGNLVNPGTAQLEADLDYWTAELERRRLAVNAAFSALGVRGDKELTELVNERFPDLFLSRAQTIALTLLDENEDLVLRESARLGLDLPGAEAGPAYDPMVTSEMRTGAGELAMMQEVFGASYESMEEFEEAEQASLAAEAEALEKGEDPPEDQGREVRAPFRDRRNQLGLKYPLLLRVWDYSGLSRMPDREIEAFAGETFREILSNIKDTRENIKEGDLKTWHLNDVFAMTAQDLGITTESPLYRSVQWRVQEEERDKSILDKAITAIGLAAAILAALPSAGTSLVIAGTAIATAAGVYQLSQSVGAYAAEKSAENVALDPRMADISAGSPDLWPVALDLIGLGLDVADVVKVLGIIGKDIRAARVTGKLDDLILAASEIPELGAKGVQAIVKRTAREQAVHDAVSRTIRAVGGEFSPADIARVERQIVELGDEALRRGWEDLITAGHIRPLDGENLLEIYTSLEIAEQALLSKGGIYHRPTGTLFLKGDRTVGSLASVTVHEITHHLQEIYRPGMTKFAREFESYTKQRDYLQRLMRDGVDPTEGFPHHAWLADATDERIVQHIWDVNRVRPPDAFEYQAAVRDAIDNVGRMELSDGAKVVGIGPSGTYIGVPPGPTLGPPVGPTGTVITSPPPPPKK